MHGDPILLYNSDIIIYHVRLSNTTFYLFENIHRGGDYGIGAGRGLLDNNLSTGSESRIPCREGRPEL